MDAVENNSQSFPSQSSSQEDANGSGLTQSKLDTLRSGVSGLLAAVDKRTLSQARLKNRIRKACGQSLDNTALLKLQSELFARTKTNVCRELEKWIDDENLAKSFGMLAILDAECARDEMAYFSLGPEFDMDSAIIPAMEEHLAELGKISAGYDHFIQEHELLLRSQNARLEEMRADIAEKLLESRGNRHSLFVEEKRRRSGGA